MWMFAIGKVGKRVEGRGGRAQGWLSERRAAGAPDARRRLTLRGGGHGCGAAFGDDFRCRGGYEGPNAASGMELARVWQSASAGGEAALREVQSGCETRAAGAAEGGWIIDLPERISPLLSWIPNWKNAMVAPFIILLVGMAMVIGLIIGLRIHAFFALIAAAMAVSLLAPGDVAEKVSRVAAAFGNTAGGIGIVIGLAAVVGKCMMESGAADRIVRAFLRSLGEKRVSAALSGSGFALSIPVFFDTVFYLLIPLARSLFENTKKHYVRYLLAISGGGVITHSLVPPTPGPLLMAEQLEIDLGVMIGVGIAIGIPAAFAGLLFGSFLDRRMPVEMRPLPGEGEKAETQGHAPNRPLPGLLVSLLPILLPVFMIGSNTALESWANAERAARIQPEDVGDIGSLYRVVVDLDDPLGSILRRVLPARPSATPQSVAAALNEALANRNLFPAQNNLKRKNLAWVEYESRRLIESALPGDALAPMEWNTPARRAANFSKVYGNANFALLVSAVFSVLLYARQQRPTRAELSGTLESALMSGGIIILITSAGGAFGAMLAAAEIGAAVEALFPARDGGMGIELLFIAFGLASLLKIAQGSTTVSVITVSTIAAAIIADIDLTYHPVYLATAIGGGGLAGSWMNDSGFWIFSKMSGLTELETLRSWTPLLAVVGVTIFVFSLLMAAFVPLA